MDSNILKLQLRMNKNSSGPPLVITSNLCFMSGLSPFYSYNLCLYPTIHSSRHIIYICIRTFPSAPSPVGVCTRVISASLPLTSVCIQTILSLFTFSNMCFYPQHHLFVLSLLPCLFPDHHLLDISVLFVSRPSSLFLLYFVCIPKSSSPNPICTMFVNCELCFLCFNPYHTLYSVFVSASSTIFQLYSVLLC